MNKKKRKEIYINKKEEKYYILKLILKINKKTNFFTNHKISAFDTPHCLNNK